MSDWHCCMPGHRWGDDGICIRCGAYEPEKRIKKVEYASPQELAGFALRMVVERIRFRIDAMNERGLDGVSISKGFAEQIVRACEHGSRLLENPEPAQAGLTAGGGSGSANASEGATGGESAAGDAAGEIDGHLELPPIGDPAAPMPSAIAGPSLLRPAEKLKPVPIYSPRDSVEAAAVPIWKPDFDYRCDCCDNGLQAEWDFCPHCGLHQREEPSGLCLAGLAANKACRPDDTLKRCTICGFVVDTKYAAEAPAKERGPRK